MIAGRFKSTLLLGAVGAACAATPALGAEGPPAVPEATDFTRALPKATQLREPTPRAQRIADRRKGYGLEGPILYRTPPVEAQRTFDLVGVAGETHALEYRARPLDGKWSEWVEADNGDPVHTGGTDVVQVRSRGVSIEGELQFIDVDGGTAPTAGRIAAAARPSGDRRIAPKPKIVSRAKWGADDRKKGCIPRTGEEIGKVKAAVIHHTVSTDNYSEAQAPGIVLGICRFHRDGNGWNDIGYNALVDRFGNVYEGRAGGINRPIMGAQAEGHNSQTTGVATVGNRSDFAPSSAERKSLINYLAWRLDVAGIEAIGKTSLTSSGGSSTRTPAGKRIRVNRVLSHSDTNFTECAGLLLRREIPGVRRAIQRRQDQSGEEEPIDPVDPDEPLHPPVDPGGGGSAP